LSRKTVEFNLFLSLFIFGVTNCAAGTLRNRQAERIGGRPLRGGYGKADKSLSDRANGFSRQRFDVRQILPHMMRVN
jgi:hypothetical protein